mgnify:CR=1 FL=1
MESRAFISLFKSRTATKDSGAISNVITHYGFMRVVVRVSGEKYFSCCLFALRTLLPNLLFACSIWMVLLTGRDKDRENKRRRRSRCIGSCLVLGKQEFLSK